MQSHLPWLTISDVIGCTTAIFEWAESYDTKDWDRFLRNATPTLLIDYRAFMDKYWEAIPAEEFIATVKDPQFLGSKRCASQHLIGASRFVQKADDYIVGTHQMRVAHQRYTDETLKVVQRRGHASGNSTVHYRKVDGVWKWAGLEPGLRFKEHNFDNIFYQND
ncbi:putative scytalone dehydratase [Lasiosphaeris hirsuta]|uniref:Scytalone dehydratase n=1 Tax=Lasiosphaeris hirsuta TaxID=260670 RepID=A0AA40EA02_9PEZI|nr:putative scytalone dehydratase [Lasiosphaeris hirsuta]